LNDLFVHLWRKTIPSVFFAFMIVKRNICILGCNIIRCNFLICKLGSNFSGPLSAILFGMTHCTTVLTGSFSIGCGLVGFLNLIVGCVDLRFGLEWRDIDCGAFSLIVLSIPRDFFNVFGSILHWWRVVYYWLGLIVSLLKRLWNDSDIKWISIWINFNAKQIILINTNIILESVWLIKI
jgi:hypothetical protein